MNLATFERAQLAAFAYRQARGTGSLDCMKCICYVLRNRVKAGWGDGSWLSVLEGAPLVDGNVYLPEHPVLFAAQDRMLQMLLREIDDIYLEGGMKIHADDTWTVVQDALYYQFADRDPNPWFLEHILRDTKNHPRIGQVGTIMLFR